MSCHVMSCHVMSCRHYCIDSHKNILETFLSIKNFIKHFAGIFTRINGDKTCHYEGEARSNPNMDCHASLCSARDDGESKSRTRCAPHGDDNDKNFQFDKYWGLFFKNELFFNVLFSVIYKKNLLIWRFCL